MTLKSPSSYFSFDLFKFLKDVSKNNNRPWFAKNRERYEKVLLQPCLRFVREASPRLKLVGPEPGC